MAYALFGSAIKLINIGYPSRANAIRPYEKRYINNFHVPKERAFKPPPLGKGGLRGVSFWSGQPLPDSLDGAKQYADNQKSQQDSQTAEYEYQERWKETARNKQDYNQA